VRINFRPAYALLVRETKILFCRYNGLRRH
jgi:hypothetical protein